MYKNNKNKTKQIGKQKKRENRKGHKKCKSKRQKRWWQERAEWQNEYKMGRKKGEVS